MPKLMSSELELDEGMPPHSVKVTLQSVQPRQLSSSSQEVLELALWHPENITILILLSQSEPVPVEKKVLLIFIHAKSEFTSLPPSLNGILLVLSFVVQHGAF